MPAAASIESFELLSGRVSFIAVGLLKDVVNTKKVMSKKPRSTIGVRSTFVDCFLLRRPFFLLVAWLVCISAIKVVYSEMQCRGVSINAACYAWEPMLHNGLQYKGATQQCLIIITKPGNKCLLY